MNQVNSRNHYDHDDSTTNMVVVTIIIIIMAFSLLRTFAPWNFHTQEQKF